MTLASTARNEAFQELIRDLNDRAHQLDQVDNGTMMLDRLYKLKATATEAIEFLKDEETSVLEEEE